MVSIGCIETTAAPKECTSNQMLRKAKATREGMFDECENKQYRVARLIGAHRDCSDEVTIDEDDALR